MSENITEEELHELIKENLPRLKIVRYDDMLLVDKLVCFYNRLDRGIRVWGEYRPAENVIFLLAGMPKEVQLDVVGFHEGRRFLGGTDTDKGMYNEEAEDKYFGKRTILTGVVSGLVEMVLSPIKMIGLLSRGFQMGVLKRKIYLEDKK